MKIIQKIISNPVIILIITLKDIKEIFMELLDIVTAKNIYTASSSSFDWWDFVIKLVIATALWLLLKQYFKLRDEIILHKLFSQTLFENTYKLSELTADRKNKVITEIRNDFSEKVKKHFNDKKLSDIEKMINQYYKYSITLFTEFM